MTMTIDGSNTISNPDVFTRSGALGAIALSATEFTSLVAANGLVAGIEYYIASLPARWIATSGTAYDGVGFVQNGVTYWGSSAVATQTEIDLAAGTWATRPLTGFTSGTMYFRRMTDIGTAPGGAVMSWLGGTSTEWRVTGIVDVFNDFTTTTGAQNTTEQALNPKDLPAGILNACGEFEIILVGGKSGTTDAVDSIKARLGTAGTTADTLLNGVLSSAVAAGDRARTGKHRYYVTSSTTIASTDSQQGNTGYYGSTTSTADAFTSYAVTAANALKLTCNVKLATAVTDSPQCRRICLRLFP